MNQHEINQPVIIHITNEADWMPVMKKIEQIWPEARWMTLRHRPTEFHPNQNLGQDLGQNVPFTHSYLITIGNNKMYWEAINLNPLTDTSLYISASTFLALNDKPGEEVKEFQAGVTDPNWTATEFYQYQNGGNLPSERHLNHSGYQLVKFAEEYVELISKRHGRTRRKPNQFNHPLKP